MTRSLTLKLAVCLWCVCVLVASQVWAASTSHPATNPSISSETASSPAAGVRGWIRSMYDRGPLAYATFCMVVVLGTGIVLGVGVDWFVRQLGIDLTNVRRHE